MAHVLSVAALQLSHPVSLLILMEAPYAPLCQRALACSRLSL